MKVLAIIPARGGSKGVPGKNIKNLGGKPLIAYTIERAFESKKLSKIVLSSEDEEIINTAKNLGIEVPFVRPMELATDQAKSIDVVNHAVLELEKNNEFFDAVCLLQISSPFREKGFIDKAIQKFIDENVDALISVLKVPHEFNPHWTFIPDNTGHLRISTGDKEIITRRQDLPTSYYRDGSIYITKTDIIKKGSFYGEKLGYIENNPKYFINIDTLEDWKKAKEWIRINKQSE